MRLFQAIFILLIAASCNGLSRSEKEKIRRANVVEEPIYRHSDEFTSVEHVVAFQERENYPWESRIIGTFPRVTKEFFRCRGAINHPERTSGKTVYRDCGGAAQHSLPLRDGEEFVYPILIDLLNHVQGAMNKRVVVTSAHRCPAHNSYVDIHKSAKYSKHMLGAEVNFYVEGAEDRPFEVIKHLMAFYQKDLEVKEKLPFVHFSKATPDDPDLKNPLWMNREIVIHLYEANEGRDLDNIHHGYPYISIELRYDRDRNRRVDYNWNDAHQSLLMR